jgi:uncharacterized protein involved in exopolysaccharide biosynthesis
MVTVKDTLDIFFRRRRLIAVSFVAILSVFACYVVFSPDTYEARVRYLVKNARAPIVAAADGNASSVAEQVSDAQIATELQLLSAQPVLRAVALQALGQTHQRDDDSEAALQAQIRRLEKALKVGPVLRSNLIEVRYTDSDPDRAVRVLRVLTTEYMDRQLALRGGKENYDFFLKQAEASRLELEGAQADLARFQADTDVVALSEQREQSIRRLMDSQAARNEAEALQAELERRATVLRAQIQATPPRISTARRSVPNQYSMERLNTLLVELVNKRTELMAKFRPEDRVVLQIEKQIEQTRAALESATARSSDEETSDVNPIRQQAEAELARTEQALRGAKARSEALSRQGSVLQSSLRKLALAGPREAELARRLRDAEQNYALHSKKRDQLRVDGLMDDRKFANIAVVEPPTLPDRAKPKVTGPLVALFVLLNGGVLMYVLLAGGFSRTFATPRELERFAGVPVLGTLAKGTGPTYLSPALEKMRRIASDHGRGAIFCLAGVGADDETSAACRKIASDLAMSTHRPVLLVPSSTPLPLDAAHSSEHLPVVETGSGVVMAVPHEAVADNAGLRLDWVWLGLPASDFPYIVINTNPLDGSSPLPQGLHLAQGIFLVATAGKSSRSEVARSLRLLESGGCKSTGFLLRERTYPIPDFVYRHL